MAVPGGVACSMTALPLIRNQGPGLPVDIQVYERHAHRFVPGAWDGETCTLLKLASGLARGFVDAAKAGSHASARRRIHGSAGTSDMPCQVHDDIPPPHAHCILKCRPKREAYATSLHPSKRTCKQASPRPPSCQVRRAARAARTKSNSTAAQHLKSHPCHEPRLPLSPSETMRLGTPRCPRNLSRPKSPSTATRFE